MFEIKGEIFVFPLSVDPNSESSLVIFMPMNVKSWASMKFFTSLSVMSANVTILGAWLVRARASYT